MLPRPKDGGPSWRLLSIYKNRAGLPASPVGVQRAPSLLALLAPLESLGNPWLLSLLRQHSSAPPALEQASQELEYPVGNLLHSAQMCCPCCSQNTGQPRMLQITMGKNRNHSVVVIIINFIIYFVKEHTFKGIITSLKTG